MKRPALWTSVLLAGLAAGWVAAQAPTQAPTVPPASVRYRDAATYSAEHGGVSLVVMQRGKVVFEDYPRGGSDSAYELASGTKSFWGVAAVAAADDGLLELDEPVSKTLGEWRDDPSKKTITIRQLLRLTSGLASGPGRRPPTYADAIRLATNADPGQQFHYGPAPFHVFGEVLRRKLLAAERDASPLAYLQARILEPLGIEPARWRHGRDGNPHLPSGAALCARDWARFGQLILDGGQVDGRRLLSEQGVAELFVGSEANPAYGLAWWLRAQLGAKQLARIRPLRRQGDFIGNKALPKDLVAAAGAGDQRLYLIPSRQLVIVRQTDKILGALMGRDLGFSDSAFLELVLNATGP